MEESADKNTEHCLTPPTSDIDILEDESSSEESLSLEDYLGINDDTEGKISPILMYVPLYNVEDTAQKSLEI